MAETLFNLCYWDNKQKKNINRYYIDSLNAMKDYNIIIKKQPKLKMSIITTDLNSREYNDALKQHLKSTTVVN
jgi:hypothetical protein